MGACIQKENVLEGTELKNLLMFLCLELYVKSAKYILQHSVTLFCDIFFTSDAMGLDVLHKFQLLQLSSLVVVVVVRKLLKLVLIMAFACKKMTTLTQKIGGADQIAALNLPHFHWLINVLPLFLQFNFSSNRTIWPISE